MQQYIKLGKRLFPICRSITGNGIRKTLKIIKSYLPKLKIYEVKSGTKVFDWKIPSEWNIKDAYVKDKKGKKIIDFKKNNLHLVNYSIPVNKEVSKKELFNHLHTLPKQSNAIPYITSYYNKYWGFSVDYKNYLELKKKYKNNTEKFKVNINSSLNKNGSLTYGEFVVPGKLKKEILISTYVCHPSMANNELSGPLVSIALAKYFFLNKVNRYTLRFLFIPETIGSITYLYRNLKKLKKNVIAGYNLSCIGDERKYSFLPTKYGNTMSDEAALQAFKELKLKFTKYSFLKRGSDERQYNSPGVDLPVASLMRSKYGTYPEYHTSLDNFSLVTSKGLKGGFNLAKRAIIILMRKNIKKKIIENSLNKKNKSINIFPKTQIICEPNLGKRGIYPLLGTKNKKSFSKNLTNFLQYADGTNSLHSISKHIKLPYKKTCSIYRMLKKKSLITC